MKDQNQPRFRVMVTDRFDIDALALLKSDSRLEVLQSAKPVPTAAELEGVNGLIIRSRTRIDANFLASAPDLRAIVTSTSGFDHLDLEATRARDVRVMYTPEANAASACEMTWALILACSRRVIEAHRATKNGDWKRESLSGMQLQGKTLGIVGLGRIGTRMARVARAFGMSLVAFDPYQDDSHFEKEGCARTALDELLRLSDIVTFHVPSTPETHHMLTRVHLESMNRHAILVNASRGSVVAERDLIDALNLGWIKSCGLDVYEKEPLARHSALMTMNQVVLSPHLGATTAEAFAASSREAAVKMQVFASTSSVSDPLPPEASWYVAAGFAKRPHADEG